MAVVLNLKIQKKIKNKKMNGIKPQMNLWFVNIGGYKSNSMKRIRIGLVVTSSKLEVKKIAKSKWLIDYKKTIR